MRLSTILMVHGGAIQMSKRTTRNSRIEWGEPELKEYQETQGVSWGAEIYEDKAVLGTHESSE